MKGRKSFSLVFGLASLALVLATLLMPTRPAGASDSYVANARVASKQVPAPGSDDRRGNGITTIELGTDRPGADYRNFELSRPEVDLCRKACDNDPQCKAYVYVRPGAQGAAPRCLLKSEVPSTRLPSNCCASGVKIIRSAKRTAFAPQR